MKKTIQVVGAIIENGHQEILCALRSTQMSLPNHWEFPGGKVEPNETIAESIEREISEELNCTIRYVETFADHIHEYDTFIVHLHIVKCKLIEGLPTATEHASLLWLKLENLESLNWAPADLPIVKLLISI